MIAGTTVAPLTIGVTRWRWPIPFWSTATVVWSPQLAASQPAASSVWWALVASKTTSAGPSIVDSVANAAFYYGLVFSLAAMEKPPEEVTGFEEAKENFYAAAKGGLNARIRWLGDGLRPVREVIQEKLLPLANAGLKAQGVDGSDIAYYLGIIKERVRSGQNGATWQREYTARHGREWPSLLSSYFRQQERDIPVHTWEI